MKHLDFRPHLPDRMLHPMQAFIREEDAPEHHDQLRRGEHEVPGRDHRLVVRTARREQRQKRQH